MAGKFKLDIFQTLAAIDGHDLDYLDRVSEDERKGYAPPVVLRWTSAAQQNGEWYLVAANRANMYFHDIYEHPELQYKLTASCGAQRRTRHDWIPMAKQRKVSKLHGFLSTYYPEANSMEIEIMLSKFDTATFNDFVDGTGMGVDDGKAIKKLFKDR